MKEIEKMKLGYWYDANYDEEILAQRLETESLCYEYNHTHPKEIANKKQILEKLLPYMEDNCTILAPFYCDYGVNCFIGHDTFINHNAYLMDGGIITIGHHCFIGPNFGVYTAKHPFMYEERNKGYEQACPVTIGNHCWIGADVTILPGVTIGEGCVIGAKSCVTKDIPDGVIAIGNPCKVIRKITDEDSILRFKLSEKDIL